MMQGVSMTDGEISPIPTKDRCLFCEKDCELAPDPCVNYSWDYEQKAPILKDEWL